MEGESKMIIIDATFEGMNSRVDKTWKLVFSTQELTPDKATELTKALHNYVALAIKDGIFKQPEIDILNKIEVQYDDKGKSPAKRLRNVLYVLWEQDKQGIEDFEVFYTTRIERIINQIKEKLI